MHFFSKSWSIMLFVVGFHTEASAPAVISLTRGRARPRVIVVCWFVCLSVYSECAHLDAMRLRLHHR